MNTASLNQFRQPKDRQPSDVRRGYTLIELALCLVIAGVLAGIATVSLSSTAQATALSDYKDQIQSLDRYARKRAHSMGKTHWIQWDTVSQEIHLLEKNDEMMLTVASVRLKQPFNFHGILMYQNDRFKTIPMGRFAVLPTSMTPNFAIGLENTSSREQSWLVMAGATGQIITTHTRTKATHALQLTEPTRHDSN